MKILHNGKEIEQIISSYTLTGDITQVARKLELNLAVSSTDYFLPKHKIELGETIILQTREGKTVFVGRVVFKQEGEKNITKYTAYDGNIHLSRSTLSKNFIKVTPEAIARSLIAEFGLPIGEIASAGVPCTFPALKQSPYEMIMKAYTIAKKHTGKKYMLVAKAGKINVVEKGTLLNVTLDSKKNIIKTNYSESIENMINKVQVGDKQGNTKTYVSNEQHLQKYGIFQSVVEEEKGKDVYAMARNTLSDVEKKISVEALGNVDCMAGYSMMIRSGLVTGKFYIDQDVHTFSNGNHKMTLTLNFENVMDEKEVEEKIEEGEKDG